MLSRALFLAACYTPIFEKVGGAYCFWLVCIYVRASRFLMPAITFVVYEISYIVSLWKK